MRRIHPTVSPPLVGYLHHAFPLSVLFGTGNGLPWFYSNYIQLSCTQSTEFKRLITERREKFDFYLHPDYYAVHPYRRACPSPLLESCWFDREIAMVDGRLVHFLIQAVDRGYCVVACADEFHVPGMACFCERHRTHEIMIAGYDLESDTFVVHIGFDRAGDYTVDEISFGDVERAIGSADLSGHYNQLGLSLIRPAKQIPYPLDLVWIRDQLNDYLSGANSSSRYRGQRTPDDRLYGLDVYTWLTRYFGHLTRHHDCYDIRPIHVLWEHKRVMADRARYLSSRGIVPEEMCLPLDRISQKVSVLRMMMMKARVTQDVRLIERIASELSGVARVEKEVLQQFLLEIEKVSSGDVAQDTSDGLSLRRSA